MRFTNPLEVSTDLTTEAGSNILLVTGEKSARLDELPLVHSKLGGHDLVNVLISFLRDIRSEDRGPLFWKYTYAVIVITTVRPAWIWLLLNFLASSSVKLGTDIRWKRLRTAGCISSRSSLYRLEFYALSVTRNFQNIPQHYNHGFPRLESHAWLIGPDNYSLLSTGSVGKLCEPAASIVLTWP